MGSARKGTKNKRDSAKPPVIESMACPLCTASMAPRLGKFGWFYGCLRFPECRGIVNVREVSIHGEIINPDAVRERHAAIKQREVDRRATTNHKSMGTLAEWRAAMIAADTSTEPPFDAVMLPGESYAAYWRTGESLTPIMPEESEVDSEFAAMFG